MLSDAYISVIEAIKHSAYTLGRKPVLTWVNSKDFSAEGGSASGGEGEKEVSLLKDFDGIIVPGGFGESGIEGKIKAIEYARVNKIPYFGLCYGMQLATIEYARHCGTQAANTTEINKNSPHPVIDIMRSRKSIWRKESMVRRCVWRLSAHLKNNRGGGIWKNRNIGKTQTSLRSKSRIHCTTRKSRPCVFWQVSRWRTYGNRGTSALDAPLFPWYTIPSRA